MWSRLPNGDLSYPESLSPCGVSDSLYEVAVFRVYPEVFIINTFRSPLTAWTLPRNSSVSRWNCVPLLSSSSERDICDLSKSFLGVLLGVPKFVPLAKCAEDIYRTFTQKFFVKFKK